ncbi:MAG: helix-turn-helix domain-containing protein [Aureibaculum sp.]|nr:helix-turn-helix domain-containing protein [Aureibaculum sp.]
MKKLQIITQLVFSETGISRKQMIAQDRRRETVDARHLAMYLLAKHTNYTTTFIGAYLSRDHATTLHAKTKIRNMYDHDPLKQLADKLDKYCRELFMAVSEDEKRMLIGQLNLED